MTLAGRMVMNKNVIMFGQFSYRTYLKEKRATDKSCCSQQPALKSGFCTEHQGKHKCFAIWLLQSRGRVCQDGELSPVLERAQTEGCPPQGRCSSAGVLGLVQDSCLNIARPRVTQTPAFPSGGWKVNASSLNN